MAFKEEPQKRYFQRFDKKPYFSVFLIVSLLTIIMHAAQPYVDPVLDLTNVVLFYLLPVLAAAVLWGRGPSIFAALAGVLAFDLFFVPPRLSMSVADLRYVFVFAGLLLVAIITGTLASRLRDEADSARIREERTSLLYELSRRMTAESDLSALLKAVVEAVAGAVDGEAVIYVQDADGLILAQAATDGADVLLGRRERDVVRWTQNERRAAGKGTEKFPEANGFYVPLLAKERWAGAMGVAAALPDNFLSSEQRLLVEAFAGLASIAIARLQLAIEAQKARHAEESEKLRTALFNSVSHDLRTPLASITGAATSLRETGDLYDRKDRMTLIQAIQDGALQLNQLVGNLLDTARLESGMLRLNKDWCDIQDIIGVALRRSKDVLLDRPIVVDLPRETPLILADFTLIEQVIINLLYNAVKYSPPGGEVNISAGAGEGRLRVVFCDGGPGIPAEDRERVFDKFYRLDSPDLALGTGLGLSICKGFIEAHGGRIWVEDDPAYSCGSKFIFTLPITDQPFIREPVLHRGDNDDL